MPNEATSQNLNSFGLFKIGQFKIESVIGKIYDIKNQINQIFYFQVFFRILFFEREAYALLVCLKSDVSNKFQEYWSNKI